MDFNRLHLLGAIDGPSSLRHAKSGVPLIVRSAQTGTAASVQFSLAGHEKPCYSITTVVDEKPVNGYVFCLKIAKGTSIMAKKIAISGSNTNAPSREQVKLAG